MSDERELEDAEEGSFDETAEWDEIEGRKPKQALPPKSLLDALCRMKEHTQTTRIKIGNMIGACERAGWQVAQLTAARDHFTALKVSEDSLGRLIDGQIKTHPLWMFWLSSVKGIGPAMAAPLLEYLDPRSKAEGGKCNSPHVSSWYRYVGLDVDNTSGPEGDRDATRRKRGVKTGWNPYLKRHMYKIGVQFMKAKGKYGDYYQQVKRQLQERPPVMREIGRSKLWILEEPLARVKRGKLLDSKTYPKVVESLKAQGRTTVLVRRRPLNIHLMALRASVKLFLSHLHTKWREQLGLPYDPPYPIAKGHTGYIGPD